MVKIYYELQDLLGTVDEFNEQTVNMSIMDFVANTPGAYIDNDNNTPETYPDLCINWEDESGDLPDIVINSTAQTAQIISGGHPPHRPK